jgi:calcineurin-like phosphoesterase family protein
LLHHALVVAVTATAALTGSTAVAAQPDDPVIAAAGDIACDPLTDGSFNGGSGTATRCRQLYTSDQLLGAGLAKVLPLGDLQYDCGGYNAILQSYDLSWGRVKNITRPVPGNHDYHTGTGTDCDAAGNAAGYFNYFGAAAGDPTRGYYSFNVGLWHLIALNSNCAKVNGCFAGSAQEQWLRQDLMASTSKCTLAYWHHPLFTSGEYTPGITSVRPLFQALYDFNADVVLTGHDHNYERFALQDPNGNFDPALGIRQFIVGTGGKSLYSPQTPIANSEVRSSSSYGVLKLTLHPQTYAWNFVPAAGSTFTDTGGDFCDKPAGYARPVSASSTSIRFVPAYQGCASANAAHGAPLVRSSCNPARQTSGFLTVGTPEANGKPANFTGSMVLHNVGESPVDPNNGDQADMTIVTGLNDVRRVGSYADYGGELQARLEFRITDRLNGAALDQPATANDVPFSFKIPCQTTTDTSVGSTCNLTTSVDSLLAGAVKEGKRSIWELLSAQVFDGGPDGVASTADNTLFAVPGVFAP